MLLCGVCASWIMGTSMQDKDRVLWTTLWQTEREEVLSTKWSSIRESLSHTAYLQVSKETRKIKAPLHCVPVHVGTDILKASIGEHSIVIFWNEQ